MNLIPQLIWPRSGLLVINIWNEIEKQIIASDSRAIASREHAPKCHHHCYSYRRPQLFSNVIVWQSISRSGPPNKTLSFMSTIMSQDASDEAPENLSISWEQSTILIYQKMFRIEKKTSGPYLWQKDLSPLRLVESKFSPSHYLDRLCAHCWSKKIESTEWGSTGTMAARVALESIVEQQNEQLIGTFYPIPFTI